MGVSWPNLAYAILNALACGTLGVQAALALRGHGTRIQMPTAVTALVCALASGVFAALRLGRLDRFVNVFGNPSSSIAQGYYAIVLLIIVAVVAIVVMRRSEDGEQPAWASVLGLAASLVGVYALAANLTATVHSAAKTWLTVAYVLLAALVLGVLTCSAFVAASLVGVYALAANLTATVHSAAKTWLTVAYVLLAALVLGVLTCSAFGAAAEKASGTNAPAWLARMGAVGVGGTAALGVMTVVYGFVAPSLGSRRATSLTTSTYGIVPGHPSGSSVSDVAATPGVESPLFWGVALGVGVLVPLVLAVVSRKTKGAGRSAMSLAGVVCVLVGFGVTIGMFALTTSATKMFA